MHLYFSCCSAVLVKPVKKKIKKIPGDLNSNGFKSRIKNYFVKYYLNRGVWTDQFN